MMPTTSATSWWSVLFGGFSTPVTTAQAGADTAEGWAAFARALAGEPTAAFGSGAFDLTASVPTPTTTPVNGDGLPAEEDDGDTLTPAVSWLGGLEASRVIVDVTVPAQGAWNDDSPMSLAPAQVAPVGTMDVDTAFDEDAFSEVSRPVATASAPHEQAPESTPVPTSVTPDRAIPARELVPPATTASDTAPIETTIATATTTTSTTVPGTADPVQQAGVTVPLPTHEAPDAESVPAAESVYPVSEIERTVRPDQPTANSMVRPEAVRELPLHSANAVDPRPEDRPAPQGTVDVAPEDPTEGFDLLDMTDDSTPVATRETAASVPTAATTAAMGEALSRVRLSVDRVDRTVSRERAATMERATEFGARLSVRPALVAAEPLNDQTVDPTRAPETPVWEDPSVDSGVTIPSTVPHDTSTSSDTGRERTTGLGESTPVTDVRPTTGAESVRAPETSLDSRAVADLGARLRAAIVETMEQQARDELLNSTREAWTATVTVEPASLGRVDLQVTRGTGGLEVILVAAHQEAARALDAEMDDMVEELVRRDLEPAKVTVRSGDGHMESDRQPNRSQQQEDARGRRQDTDSTSDETNEREGRRGSARDHRERQAMAR